MSRARCMPWWKAPTDIRHDPRVRRLGVILRQPLADAYWLRLWCHCGQYQQDGRFAKEDAVELVEGVALEWGGESGALVSALLATGLLEDAGDSYEVADWRELNGPVVEKFERDKMSARVRRESRPAAQQTPVAEIARLPRDSRASLSPLSTLVSSSSVVASDVARARVAEPAPPERRRAPEPAREESFPDAVHRLTGWSWRPGVDDNAARALFALAATESRSGLPVQAEVLRRLENGFLAEYKRKVSSLSELARREKWRACDSPEERGGATQESRAERSRSASVGRSEAPTGPSANAPAGSRASLERWAALLAALERQDLGYTAQQLRQLQPLRLEGERLVLWAADRIQEEWVRNEFGELLAERLPGGWGFAPRAEGAAA